jgi:HEAT repeat protein
MIRHPMSISVLAPTRLARFLILVVLAIVLSGCSKKSGPVLAGGKPVEHWLQAISDPNPKVRKTAVEKLGNVGASDPAVVAALCAGLQDRNADVRCEAILGLSKSAPDAKEAIEPLKTIGKQDRDPRVRSYAARALEKLEK